MKCRLLPLLLAVSLLEGSDTTTAVFADSASSTSRPAAAAQVVTAPEILPVHITSPEPNAVIDVPSTSVTVESRANDKIVLEINGQRVLDNLIGLTYVDQASNIARRTWVGAALKPGDNVIVAWLVGPTGRSEVARTHVHVRGDAVRMTLSCSAKRIIADGISLVKIHGTLLDTKGVPSSLESLVTLSSTGGKFVGADADTEMPGYQVTSAHGEFDAILQAPTAAQSVTVTASIESLLEHLSIDFGTDLSRSLSLGIFDIRIGGRGSGMSGLDISPTPGGAHGSVSMHAGGFLKTPIGGWLLTGAYDSSRPLTVDGSGRTGLEAGTQTADQIYGTYGDLSTREYAVDSSNNLYLRLERDHDYLLYGNYATNEFSSASQQFTSVSRQFHALKSSFQKGRTQLTGLYADNVRGFKRDTISPDGTSGYYYLSQRPLVVGSERVYLETQELGRPGIALSHTEQIRGIDYDIDYDRGAVLFHHPILRTEAGPDGQVLVRQIVVTYEEDRIGAGGHAYGGRLNYKFNEGAHPGSFGLTYFSQLQGLRDFKIYGGDISIGLPNAGSLITEYAHSFNASELFKGVNGSAARLEFIQPFAKNARSRVYWQSAGTGFANDAAITFVPGQTRYGGELSAPVSRGTRARVRFDREINKGVAPIANTLGTGPAQDIGNGVNNTFTNTSVGIEHQSGKVTAALDVVATVRVDNAPGSAARKGAMGSLTSSSTQVRARIATALSKQLDASIETRNSISSQTDAIVGDQTSLTLHWKGNRGVGVSLVEQILTSGQYSGRSATSLILDGAAKTLGGLTFKSQVALQSSSDGLKIVSSTGTEKNWDLTRGLTGKAYFEQVSGSLAGKSGAGQQSPLPFAAGSGAYALSAGSGTSAGLNLQYVRPGFTASAKYELRTSSYGKNTVISAAAQGKLNAAVTGLASYDMASSSNNGPLTIGPASAMRIGLAYRNPMDDRWNFLLRYDRRIVPSTAPLSITQGTGNALSAQTFAVEGIYAPSWRWEFYGKYAMRDSNIALAQDYTAHGKISLFQTRATCRFAYNMDANLEGRWVSQPTVGMSSSSAAADIGYYLTPNFRLAVGYSFGRIHDQDFTGSDMNRGFFLGLTAKTDTLYNGFGLLKSRSTP